MAMRVTWAGKRVVGTFAAALTDTSSSQKDVVLVAASERQRFPFDVQHRNVITYLTDSPRDFEDLRERITKRINALLKKELRLGTAAAVVSPVAALEGLAQHQLV